MRLHSEIIPFHATSFVVVVIVGSYRKFVLHVRTSLLQVKLGQVESLRHRHDLCGP